MTRTSNSMTPFEVLLDAAGATFDYRLAEFGQGLAMTTDYRFRYTADEVQIAVNSKFDRWANSVHMVCRPVPATQDTFDALLGAIAKAIREKRANPDGWEAYDIWPLVRKIRRERRSAHRLAARQGESVPQPKLPKNRLQRLALKVRKKVTRDLQLAREHPQVKDAFFRTWQSWGMFNRLMPSADHAWRAVENL